MTIIAPLFVLLGVGVIAGFWRRFQTAQAGLNAFVFTFSLPAFLFTALASAPISAGIPLPFLLVSFALPAMLALGTYGSFCLWKRVSPRDSGSDTAGPFVVAATYGNVGYLGVPIAMSIVGPSAALAAALGQLLHNLIFMVGYPLVKSFGRPANSATADGSARMPALLWRILKRSLLLNPVAIGVATGALASVLPVEIPHVLNASIMLLGQAAVPTAMFAVGLSIKPALEGMRSGSVPLGAVLIASSVKILILPLLTILALVLLSGSLAPEWVATAVIMSAMPVSSTASIIVFEYDGDTRLTSAATLLTSIAGIFTIPAMLALTP